MPETKDASADDKPAKKAAPVAALALPDIHALQAERQTLQMNRNALAALPPVDAEIAALDKRIAEIDKQLP